MTMIDGYRTRNAGEEAAAKHLLSNASCCCRAHSGGHLCCAAARHASRLYVLRVDDRGENKTPYSIHRVYMHV